MKKQSIVDYFNNHKLNLILYSAWYGVDQFYDRLDAAVQSAISEDIRVAARRLLLEVPTNVPKISGYYILERIGNYE